MHTFAHRITCVLLALALASIGSVTHNSGAQASGNEAKFEELSASRSQQLIKLATNEKVADGRSATNPSEAKGYRITDPSGNSTEVINAKVTIRDGEKQAVSNFAFRDNELRNSTTIIEDDNGTVSAFDGNTRVLEEDSDQSAQKSDSVSPQYKKHSKCWWAERYAEGTIAWSTFVAAVGGASALVDGPIGAIIAAAGGVGAASGGLEMWAVHMVCG